MKFDIFIFRVVSQQIRMYRLYGYMIKLMGHG